MKKRVYKIKDKILVQGDENLLTEDEVLVKEENGSVLLKERINGEIKNVVADGGSSNIKYYNVSNFIELAPAEDIDIIFRTQLNGCSILYKWESKPNAPNKVIFVSTAALYSTYSSGFNIVCLAIDWDLEITESDNSSPFNTTIKMFENEHFWRFVESGLAEGIISEITKEQFYDLTLPTE